MAETRYITRVGCGRRSHSALVLFERTTGARKRPGFGATAPPTSIQPRRCSRGAKKHKKQSVASWRSAFCLVFLPFTPRPTRQGREQPIALRSIPRTASYHLHHAQWRGATTKGTRQKSVHILSFPPRRTPRCNAAVSTPFLIYNCLSCAPYSGATTSHMGEFPQLSLIICVPEGAQPCRQELRPQLCYSPRPRGATPASLSLFLSHFLTFNCSTEWFFCGGFFKAKKVFCFSHAPALSCAPAHRHSPALDAPVFPASPGSPYAPAESPRRGSAGPRSPWRPFPDQKVGRLRQWRAAFCVFTERNFVFWTPLPHFFVRGGGRLL